MRRAVLALPLLALALHCDLLYPRREIPPDSVSPDFEQVYPALPARNEGRFGKPGDPLGMLFVGSESQLRAALTEAGWTSIPLNIPASIRGGLKELSDGRALARFPP